MEARARSRACVCVCVGVGGGWGGERGGEKGAKESPGFFLKKSPAPTHPSIKSNGRFLMRDRQINSRERGTPVFQSLASFFFFFSFFLYLTLSVSFPFKGYRKV